MTMRTRVVQSALLFALTAIASAVASGQQVMSISPTSVGAGASNLTLTVNGSGFVQYSTILFNGQWISTTHSGTTTLKGVIPSSSLTTAATVLVSVGNASTGTISNSLPFTITGSTGGGSGGGGAKVTINITSPVQNQTLCSPVTLIASAVTSASGAVISKWQVLNQSGTSLWTTSTPTYSIQPSLKLGAGSRTLQVKAWDSAGNLGTTSVAFTVSTATPPCGGSTQETVGWQACWYSQGGNRYQAMRFQLSQPETAVLQAELYSGPGCNPANWNDQLNDTGAAGSFGTFGYLYWFIYRANQTDMSAVWTLGNQSSGCVNYNTAPSC